MRVGAAVLTIVTFESMDVPGWVEEFSANKGRRDENTASASATHRQTFGLVLKEYKGGQRMQEESSIQANTTLKSDKIGVPHTRHPN